MPTIGISQLVEHPALDSARQGFIDALEDEGFKDGENISILLENAQSDIPTTQTIANKLVADEVDIILAIATPCAQSAVNATRNIPILYTAVTDPVQAGLIDSMEKPGGNVTGTSDMNPIKEQFELIKEIFPNIKKIGVIYNAAEPNSTIQVDIAKKVCKNLGLNLIEATAASSSEVSQAAQTIVGKVDILYTPTDNTVASAIAAVVKVANDAKVPVFGAERAHVDGGAFATLGIDYYQLGKQTGKMAVKILQGEKPANIPSEMSREFKSVINKKAVKLLGIDIPKDILDKVDEIIEK